MTTKTLTVGPRTTTALPGPKARRILAGDEQYVSPSYTRSYPMVAKRGRGVSSKSGWERVLDSRPASPWPRPAIAIRRWSPPSSNRPPN